MEKNICFLYVLYIFGFIIPVESYYYIGGNFPSYERRKGCSTYVNLIQPSARVWTTERLEALRKAMKNEVAIDSLELHAYIITSDDEHQTEFVSEHDKRREYITGFSGGRGDAIVTQDKAALWVEGRYHLQADEQTDCNWLLMREGFSDDVPTRTEWLRRELPKGARVGADPRLISQWRWKSLEEELSTFGLALVGVDVNLIDVIWTEGRPRQRYSDVFLLSEQFTGKHYTTKIKELRQELKRVGVNAMIITALDEIAWLLNIRGRDIPYHPYVRSYLLLDMYSIILYVNESQLIDNEIHNILGYEHGASKTSVVFQPYDRVWLDLPTYAQSWEKVLIPSKCSYSLGASHAIHSLVEEKKLLSAVSPIIRLKAIKNQVETRGMLSAHVKDAAALCIFFEYFETRFKEGDAITELDVVDVLRQIRYEQINSTGNSFRTIAAYGPNGALPHYEPSESTNVKIGDNSTLVLDSGGQYLDGTTDITRTIHLGVPYEAHKKLYTRVLMSHIELSSLVFPSTVDANTLDITARAPLWEEGLDYLHETSHGIGSYLGAHESPININYRDTDVREFLEPGYFLSSEPGIYREEEFGVRLENVMRVVEKTDLTFNNITYLAFEDVTLFPYDYKLIDFSLLTNRHRRWLEEYNGKVRVHVGHELKRQKKMNAFHWMMRHTGVLPSSGYRHHFVLTRIAIVFIPFMYSHLFVDLTQPY